MNVPASTHHINDATSSAQPAVHSQTSLQPESMTWVSKPVLCKADIQNVHLRTRVFGTLLQESALTLGSC
jgi:hypothetical protein